MREAQKVIKLMALSQDLRNRGTLGVQNSFPIVFDQDFPQGTCRCIISADDGWIHVQYNDDSEDIVPVQRGFNFYWIKKIFSSGTSGVNANELRAGY